ncbi:Rab GTPase activating protein [Entamoeba marina]
MIHQLGYTQGMSCVPAMLTLFLDQQTTFCGYQKILTRKYRLREMFGDFEFIRKCWRVTKRILETNYPKIAQKFREMNIFDQPLPFFMFEWHYLWFIHSVKFDLALRIFDVILLEGFPALFSVANAIFHFIEQPILNETNPNILQQKLKSPFDLLNVQPTTNVFMSYMYKHQIDSGPILAYFD